MSSKVIPPYRAAMSVNHHILKLSCDIAFRMGRLSTMGTVKSSAPSSSEEVKYSLLGMGITLSPSQVRGLTEEDSSSGVPQADAFLALLKRLPKLDPYSPELIKEFETSLFPEGVPYRMTEKLTGISYPLPPSSKAKGLLSGLFDFAKKNQEIMSPVTMGCLLYYEVLAIASYKNGNETLAYFLLKAFLGEAGRSMDALPLAKSLYFGKDKLDEAFLSAAKAQDSAPFVEELLELILSDVNALLRLAGKEAGADSPLVDRLLSKMADGRYYSANELCALLGLKSRLGLQKNYLRPALNQDKIVMSNPLTPTDRHQRYAKKKL